MIITKTPFRISFLGGGTDYPDWYKEHGGAVISTSIDKYCYITCRHLPPFFEHKHRIVYSQIETVATNAEIQHPAVRAVFDWADVKEGLEIHYDGDLPARSGLGSSSAFTVGLVHAVQSLYNQESSTEVLAKNAIHIEQNLIGENVGSQDQIAVACGGFNRIDFSRDNTFDITRLVIEGERIKQFRSHLLLCFTGVSRIADEIAYSKLQNFKSRTAELLRIREIVDEGEAILTSNSPITEFGELLDESWSNKRKLSQKVSTPVIDELYSAAKEAGAIGGKILGAGGGGFLLIFARPQHHANIKKRLSGLTFVDFEFDSLGSQLIYREDAKLELSRR